MTETTGDRRQQPTREKRSERDRYRLLADERRRVVADVLAEESSAVTLGELTAAVEARETGGTGSVDAERALEIQLHHVHLPLLDEAGVLDYDPDANRVEPRPSALDWLRR